MIPESFSKEQLTRTASTTLSVSKYQHNNFHYFQTTGTTGTLLEILPEHTPSKYGYTWCILLLNQYQASNVLNTDRSYWPATDNNKGLSTNAVCCAALCCAVPCCVVLRRAVRSATKTVKPN